MKNSILPLGVRVVIVPVGSLIGLILISIIAFRVGFSQITKTRAKLEQARKSEKILSAKVDFLSGIESAVISQTNVTVAALPDRNPAVLTLSQIRSIAMGQNVFISNIKIGGGGTVSSGGLSAINISFDADGNLFSLVNLISSIKEIAPITHVTKVVLNFSGGASQANISVKSYYANFPTKIPSVTDPSTPLGDAENKTLESISSLSIPSLVSLSPTAPFERVSPFGE